MDLLSRLDVRGKVTPAASDESSPPSFPNGDPFAGLSGTAKAQELLAQLRNMNAGEMHLSRHQSAHVPMESQQVITGKDGPES